MRISTILLATTSSLLIANIAHAEIYKCKINGITSYSQFPCDEGDKSKGTYQPNPPSMTYKPTMPLAEYYLENEKVPVNTMDAGDAISIYNTQCNRDSYSGVIQNISAYSTYVTTITVAFKYYKLGMDKKIWDRQTKVLKLQPGRSTLFSIKGRAAPTSYNIDCVVSRHVKFVDSTVTR
ncbi:DUF4124 domain-containing protein [Shewanella carassii]|uniref:DUF4124 domain-containing protein n=1 Tax=Shewanella carassii TaxID=1987584 RepID=A0ABQ1SZZ8_9GAMM|nr:DUF4124 domain-containing protein [Shewanella carassii]GGE75537.1 hypothetical protein GCM10011520_15160 [Shewanella carassii]